MRRSAVDNRRMAVTQDLGLVGREEELGRLRDFVAALADGATAAVIHGDAGIGKTVLWRAAIEAAEQSGVNVLLTRSVEAEMPLALGGINDLLDRDLADAAEDLAEPQRRTLAVALGLEAPTDETPDRIALPRAFVACLRALAVRTPLLVAIDDVQWLDPASRRIVAFAVKRLGDAPVGILATQRGSAEDPLDLRHALDQRLAEIRLGPLSAGALRHLIRTRLGVRIPGPTLARLHESSGGNPMFALEFARSLADGDRPQLGPMQVPPSLRDLVHARVERYPQDVRNVLAIVAAAERPTPSLLATVDAAAPGLLEQAADALAVAIGDDGIVRFTHPLVASAVYEAVPTSQRRSIHARLAQVAPDVEERARHLALASIATNAGIAALRDEAAARAFARGAPEAATELAKEAIRRTPPSDLRDRDERALRVAVYLAAAGLPAEAAAYLDRLLASGASGPRRAETLLLRVVLVEHDLEACSRALAEALEHVGDDLALRARVLLMVSSNHLYRGDLAASEETARQALAAAEDADESALVSFALASVADRADLAGHPDDALLERAVALAAVHPTPHLLPRLEERRARRLVRKGDLAGSRELLEAELERAVRTGVQPDRSRILGELVDVEWRAGHLELAARHLDDAWEVAVEDGGDRWGEAELQQRRGRLAALRGDVDDTRRLVASGRTLAEAMQWPHLAAMNSWVLGFLELSLGEPARAWEAFQDVPETSTWGRLEVVEAVADTAETLVALGRLEAADDLVATLQADAGRGHLWAAPAVLRCSALLVLARGDGVGAAGAAEDAAAGFEAAGFPLDHGRALLVAGQALRRAGQRRRAAVRLQAARNVFSGVGAVLWAERAANELRRASPRPRRTGELTGAERRVAALVAEGRTNREVAAQLFITPGSVEVHLTRIYRKLGVRSRTELARRAAGGTLDLGGVHT
jgi:DNA-binding CsgD family transcriptional regulator/tetratricopeptide (TPR) repeat protein